ncbi:single-stranded DNA-binding protein [Streptosporangium sandarakinum]|uniref:Single-strand DNA-binding protein n=1 Tax=Streptosporangium sandarakinum TaxID=1260955 RepID=A0A852V3G3_9ACTN|nr:single-stranded DNA-binding protein [Streptosporangium sandarakinum]NYF41883.1 single-strand DNA-binding protein [Streptosporangium sandarakinum]
MNDIQITLTGNVAAPPRQHTFPDGSRVTSLKVASTSRYFDRDNQQWCNGETTYFGVRCFRGLADNVAQSVRLGQPIVVQGRLRIREFVHEGERRFMPEVEASSLGHDLRWGLGSFTKPMRGGIAPSLGRDERSELDHGTHDWAMGGLAAPAATPVPGVPAGSVRDAAAVSAPDPDPAAVSAPGALTLVGSGDGAAGGQGPAVRDATGGTGAEGTATGEAAAGAAAERAGEGSAGADRPGGEGAGAGRTGEGRPGEAARRPSGRRSPRRESPVPEETDETPWPVEVRAAA